MAETSIEWTEKVWNPTTGCDRVSPGCDNCYALTMAKRLKGMGSAKYQRDGDPKTSGPGFGVSMHPDTLTEPFKWQKPRKVFVNSMSDLFHAEITVDFIAQVFAVMALTPQHTYQILTKRHARMRSVIRSKELIPLMDDYREKFRPGCGDFEWPLDNVWLGVSVENQQWADIRIPTLLKTPAAVRFLSCEPLLGPIDLDRYRQFGYWAGALDWVIVGGESGREFRPVRPEWVRTIRDQCISSGTAFLFKQWGGIRPKSNGRELDGRTWDEYPSGVTTRTDR